MLPYTPHEQIYNVPNFLTFTRILSTPALGYFILHDQTVPALALLVAAGITDVLDGWIARKWKLQTVVGSVVDPMADKLLVTVLTVSLAMKGLLPVWLTVIILGRDVGLAISAIWYRYISLPPPKTFMRYWNFSLPSAEVRPTTISKVNTLLQLGLITASTAAPILPIGEAAMVAAQYTVAVTTIWSGLSYVFSKNAVKILKQYGEGRGKGDGENGNDGKGDIKQ
ncbi:cardiolipin synthase-like protein [Terfezia boudieri ATCC MYA-4762]|uniref:Cardiolipin synthase-like protein n=1 Tax=Terfezia boudieri ATCC MYA-4762 TaxID=1051890 RepID=A0A3N4LKR8_9PEZI|nr:cardiolipin synthase-like protein [Terfezia boudieri ATCC MYA-4762]